MCCSIGVHEVSGAVMCCSIGVHEVSVAVMCCSIGVHEVSDVVMCCSIGVHEVSDVVMCCSIGVHEVSSAVMLKFHLGPRCLRVLVIVCILATTLCSFIVPANCCHEVLHSYLLK